MLLQTTNLTVVNSNYEALNSKHEALNSNHEALNSKHEALKTNFDVEIADLKSKDTSMEGDIVSSLF